VAGAVPTTTAVAAVKKGEIDALSHADPAITLVERSGELKAIFDTRTAASTCSTPPTITAGTIGAGAVLKVKITGVEGIPDNATAVVLNLTALGDPVPTYVSAYPDSPDQPSVSNLNVSNAKPVPNLAVVPIGPGGVIDFFNKVGSTNLLADLAGYFAPTGSQYTTTGPCRMFDTRSGTGICPAAIPFTAGAITGVIGFVLVLAPLAQLLPGSFGKHVHAYLPSEAGRLVAQARQGPDDLLSPWQGFGVFCLWTALLLAIATYLLNRRDA